MVTGKDVESAEIVHACEGAVLDVAVVGELMHPVGLTLTRTQPLERRWSTSNDTPLR